MSRHLVNDFINLLKIDCQQPIAAQYFGLYADPSDIGKMRAHWLTDMEKQAWIENRK